MNAAVVGGIVKLKGITGLQRQKIQIFALFLDNSGLLIRLDLAPLEVIFRVKLDFLANGQVMGSRSAAWMVPERKASSVSSAAPA